MPDPPHSTSDSDSDSDPSETTPLHIQRAFGSGLHRKPISFIRASTSTETDTTPPPVTTARKSAAEQYLAIISASSPSAITAETGATSANTELSTESTQSETNTNTEVKDEKEDTEICAVYNLPLHTKTHPQHAHESLLAHQVSLPHVHPPSALDRNRMGLRYLVSRGWDPDAREGLGKDGEGMRAPVRVVEKRDTLGLGVVRPKVVEKVKKKKLGAREARAHAARERRRDEELRGWVLGRGEEVERVLRGG